jgi:hypothetical protein
MKGRPAGRVLAGLAAAVKFSLSGKSCILIAPGIHNEQTF